MKAYDIKIKKKYKLRCNSVCNRKSLNVNVDPLIDNVEEIHSHIVTFIEVSIGSRFQSIELIKFSSVWSHVDRLFGRMTDKK